MDFANVCKDIVYFTKIQQIAETAGVEYEQGEWESEDSNRRVNEWLIHHMDETPFHKLCYPQTLLRLLHHNSEDQ